MPQWTALISSSNCSDWATHVRLGDVLFQTKYNNLIESLVAGPDVIATILAVIALVAVIAVLIGGISSVAIPAAAGGCTAAVAIVVRAIVATGRL